MPGMSNRGLARAILMAILMAANPGFAASVQALASNDDGPDY